MYLTAAHQRRTTAIHAFKANGNKLVDQSFLTLSVVRSWPNDVQPIAVVA